MSLITEDDEYTREFRTKLNTGQAIGTSLQKIWKSHSITISTKIGLRLMKALVWPTAVKAGHSERMKKHVLMPMKWKDWERFCGLRGQQGNKWVVNKQSWSKEETVRHESGQVSLLEYNVA